MRKILKIGLILVLLVSIFSCAAWKGMGTAEKIDATVAYYQSFSKGLTVAAELAAQVHPELKPSVDVAMNAINVLDRTVNLLALLKDNDQIEAQMRVVYGAAQAANAAVGAVVHDDESALQSFFDGSIPVAHAIRLCPGAMRFGIQCPGPLGSLG
jgi:hypothetical protein